MDIEQSLVDEARATAEHVNKVNLRVGVLQRLPALWSVLVNLPAQKEIGRIAAAYASAMSDPKKHHHVPQFLLEGWRRVDGRLAVYSRMVNRVVIDWHTAEYTAFEPHLYSISALPEDRYWVEREVMSKRVDNRKRPPTTAACFA